MEEQTARLAVHWLIYTGSTRDPRWAPIKSAERFDVAFCFKPSKTRYAEYILIRLGSVVSRLKAVPPRCNSQENRQTERQAGSKTCRERDRQADRQRQAEREPDGEKYREYQVYAYRQLCKLVRKTGKLA